MSEQVDSSPVVTPNDEDATPAADHSVVLHAIYQAVLRRPPFVHEISHFGHCLDNGMAHLELVKTLSECDEFRTRDRIHLFSDAGHFYSPIVDPQDAATHMLRVEASPPPDHLPGIPLQRANLTALWREMVPYFRSLPFQAERVAPFRYQYDNTMYARGDASVLSAMINIHRPRRIVEIGSGWSSACMLDTIEHILGLDTHVTFIEPYPEILREVFIDDYARIDVIEQKVQDVDLTIYDDLASGDILFIDSSHVMKTASDVNFELFEILPRLRPGVVVHFHDIFWPFEYPKNWVLQENRSWNEVYALRAFLTGTREWEVIFFNDYMLKVEKALVETTYPEFLENSGGGIWLKKLGEPGADRS